MKTRIILILLSITLLSPLFAQSDKGMAHLKICQEYKRQLIEILERNYPTASAINIWIIPPMGCPRCEGISSVAMTLFKKLRPGEKNIVWVDKYQKENLKQYLGERKYPCDTILDSNTGILSQWLSLNIGDFQTPHYLRYNARKKEFTIERPLLGSSVSEEWVETILKESEGIIPTVSCGETREIKKANPEESENIYNEIRKFTIPGDMPELLHADISPDRQEFAVIDRFSWDLIRLSKKTAETERIKLLSLLPLDTFIAENTPKSIINMMKKSGMINNMIFNPKFSDNGNAILLSASLPKITFQNDEVSYYNEATFIRYQNKQAVITGTLDFDKKSDVHPNHTRFYPSGKNGWMYLKCSKGWPIIGTSPSVPAEEKENPFRKDFYTHAPTLAIVNAEGKMINTLGKLDAIFSKIRTGYYYNDITGSAFRDTFYYTGGFTGEIFSQYNYDTPVFRCPEIVLMESNLHSGDIAMATGQIIPMLKTTDAPVLDIKPDSQLNYIMKFKDTFNKSIEEFAFNETQIGIILNRDSGEKHWILYNRFTGKEISRTEIPRTQFGGTLKNCLIGRDANNRLYLESIYVKGNTVHWCSL